MKEKMSMTPPVVGASSMLVIFAVLCLTIFALLSISTVQANGRLSDHAANAVINYYEADAQAESILAELRAGKMPEGVTKEENLYSYQCKISDTQALVVQIMLEGNEYTVLRWQVVSDIDWQADDRRPVWNGEG
jgi:hypothetical protein